MFVKDFNDNEKVCFSELLVIMSSIDGEFSMDEMMIVDKYMEVMGIQTLPASIRSVDEIADELSKSADTVKHAVIFELSMVARADRKIEETESHLLIDLCKKLSISREKATLIFEAAEKMSEARSLVSKAIN